MQLGGLRAIVMYAGRVIEEANIYDLFGDPRHPYTIALLGSVPRMDQGRQRLNPIVGFPPDPISPGKGCAFAPRCNKADDLCRRERPSYEQKRAGHWAACWHSDA